MTDCPGCERNREEIAALRAAVATLQAGQHVRSSRHAFGIGDGAEVRLTLGRPGSTDSVTGAVTIGAPYIAARNRPTGEFPAVADGYVSLSQAASEGLIFCPDGITEYYAQPWVWDLAVLGDVAAGTNVDFVAVDAAGTPVEMEWCMVSVNGQVWLPSGGFALDGAAITMDSAPPKNAIVRVILGLRSVI